MDPSTVALLIGVATLVVERGFAWGMHIKKMTCCGGEIDMDDSGANPTLPPTSASTSTTIPLLVSH